MSENEAYQQLIAALQADKLIASKGYTVGVCPTGGVTVERRGHVRGVWLFRGKTFYWTDAGYSESNYRTRVVANAVAHTISIVSLRS